MNLLTFLAGGFQTHHVGLSLGTELVPRLAWVSWISEFLPGSPSLRACIFLVEKSPHSLACSVLRVSPGLCSRILNRVSSLRMDFPLHICHTLPHLHDFVYFGLVACTGG